MDELATELNISKKYAYQFLRESNLKYIRIGKKLYISRKILEEYLREKMEG